MSTCMERYNISILGKDYPLEGDIPKKRIKDIEDYLNCKLQELRRSAPMVPLGRLTMLACLNIANEFFEQKAIYKNKLEYYERHIDDVISDIDNVL